MQFPFVWLSPQCFFWCRRCHLLVCVWWIKNNGVGDMSTPSGGNITLVTMIIFWCWCYIESFSAMWCPGLSLSWIIKAEDVSAWRCQGNGIVIVFTKEVHACHYFGVTSCWLEHIKHEFSLLEKVIPSVLWKMGVIE